MLNGPEIISKFLGESEKNLRLVAVVFIVMFEHTLRACAHVYIQMYVIGLYFLLCNQGHYIYGVIAPVGVILR